MMRAFGLPGLVAALALALLPASAGAGSGGHDHRLNGPFPGPPLGALQNEAWGRLGLHQYLRANPPRHHVHPHHRGFVWIEPSWQWNGFQWMWVPGYWTPRH
jgi:hypothetical protein